MKVARPSFLVLVLLLFSVACNPSSDTSATTKAVSAPVVDVVEIQQNIKTGRLRFEIRGLTNEVQEKSYGAKSFQHSAVVIPVGDSKYVKGDFLVVFSVKRLSGGDPENTRKPDDITMVYIHEGMGRFTESGGYKAKDEKWEPEKIEVRPQVVFIGAPIVGTAVQE